MRQRLGVDLAATFNLVGGLVKYLSLAPLIPAAIAIGYGESPAPFLLATAIGFFCGWAMEWMSYGKKQVGMREGFLVVSLTWLFAAMVGALPYWLTAEAQFASPVDSYFEAMSGFTTTGATIVTDIEGLPHGLAMWRQLTQWLGGMGIIVLALAVLPRLRVGGRQLLETELPGPEIEEMTLRIRETAQRLWLLYIALTALMVAVLSVIAWTGLDSTMSFYEAVAHALTTLPTGGFSTRARSLEEFGAASQWAIAFFMVVAGVNFALMYRAFFRRQPRVFVRDEEFRLYLTLLALGSAVLVDRALERGRPAGRGGNPSQRRQRGLADDDDRATRAPISTSGRSWQQSCSLRSCSSAARRARRAGPSRSSGISCSAGSSRESSTRRCTRKSSHVSTSTDARSTSASCERFRASCSCTSACLRRGRSS